MKDSKEDIEFGREMYNFLNRTYPDGKIPMQVFNKVEALVRPFLRATGRRVIYRGPRIHNHTSHKPGMTCRQDAKFAVLYYLA